jgi:hypothetical protein
VFVFLAFSVAAQESGGREEGTGLEQGDSGGAQPSSGQQSQESPESPESEIFSESQFEETVEEATRKEEEKPDPLRFGGNFTFSNVVSAGYDFDEYYTEGVFFGKAYVEIRSPEHGAAYLSHLFDQPVFFGTNGRLPQPQSPAAADSFFGPAEFFLDVDVAKRVFFRAGKQLIARGATRVWRPVDFINLRRRSSLETFDLRTGKPGLKIHVTVSSSSILAFLDFSQTFEYTSGSDISVSEILESASMALRFVPVLAGFQIGITAYAGG